MFKVTTPDGIVQKLPYNVVNHTFNMSASPIYSLYVLEKPSSGNVRLREISVPDSPVYSDRTIDIFQTLADSKVENLDSLEVKQVLISEFNPWDYSTSFFVLGNGNRLFKIGFKNRLEHVSIDGLSEFRNSLSDGLEKIV